MVFVLTEDDMISHAEAALRKALNGLAEATSAVVLAHDRLVSIRESRAHNARMDEHIARDAAFQRTVKKRKPRKGSAARKAMDDGVHV